MTKTIIHSVIGIQDTTLLVFHTEAHCWQFRVINAAGKVFGEQRLYYTADTAEKAGRDGIEQGV